MKFIKNCLAVTFLILVNTVNIQAREAGDVNYDNYVNTVDSSVVLQHTLNKNFAIDEKYADVDKNNSVNAADAALIYAHILRNEVELKIGDDIAEEKIEQPVLNDELSQSLERVIRITKTKVIYNLSTYNEKKIARYILSSMEAYYADRSYNIQNDAAVAREMYYELTDEEKNFFKSIINSSYSATDVNNLKFIFKDFLQ